MFFITTKNQMQIYKFPDIPPHPRSPSRGGGNHNTLYISEFVILRAALTQHVKLGKSCVSMIYVCAI